MHGITVGGPVPDRDHHPEAGPRRPRAEQQRLALASTARTRHFRALSPVELPTGTGPGDLRPVGTTVAACHRSRARATARSVVRSSPVNPVAGGVSEFVGSHRALRPADPLLDLRHEWVDQGSCAVRSQLLGSMPSEGPVDVRNIEHAGRSGLRMVHMPGMTATAHPYQQGSPPHGKCRTWKGAPGIRAASPDRLLEHRVTSPAPGPRLCHGHGPAIRPGAAGRRPIRRPRLGHVVSRPRPAAPHPARSPH